MEKRTLLFGCLVFCCIFVLVSSTLSENKERRAERKRDRNIDRLNGASATLAVVSAVAGATGESNR